MMWNAKFRVEPSDTDVLNWQIDIESRSYSLFRFKINITAMCLDNYFSDT